MAHRTDYKVTVSLYGLLEMPQNCLKELVNTQSSSRTLRSGTANLLKVPKTRLGGDRAVCSAAPRLWMLSLTINLFFLCLLMSSWIVLLLKFKCRFLCFSGCIIIPYHYFIDEWHVDITCNYLDCGRTSKLHIKDLQELNLQPSWEVDRACSHYCTILKKKWRKWNKLKKKKKKKVSN